MRTSYRILKLKNGDELIAKIKGQISGKLILERPMVFRTLLMADPMTGMQREITVLKNWISYSDHSLDTKIPQDYIVTYSTPANEAAELYDIEKEKEDTNPKSREIKDHTEIQKQKSKDLENMLKSLDDLLNKDPSEDSETEYHFSMMLPPSILQDLIKSGMVDPSLIDFENDDDEDFDGDVADEEYTGEETDHPNFGNRWTDWNSDPDEYFE
tara:strand:- start:804 stop:1442 length:639 start_codon:yes stop_codon:yes gene_type:complete